MKFRAEMAENGDRHLVATCPNGTMEINMGRSVPIARYMESRQKAMHEANRRRVAQSLNRVFEYSTSGVPSPEEDDVSLTQDSASSALLSNMYIYETPDRTRADQAQAIRRQINDLHENMASIPDYEAQLEGKVKEWMNLNVLREQSTYLPGHIRSTLFRKITRDPHQTQKFAHEPAAYMHHYTSDPGNLSIQIGNPPVVVQYRL